MVCGWYDRGGARHEEEDPTAKHAKPSTEHVSITVTITAKWPPVLTDCLSGHNYEVLSRQWCVFLHNTLLRRRWVPSRNRIRGAAPPPPPKHTVFPLAVPQRHYHVQRRHSRGIARLPGVGEELRALQVGLLVGGGRGQGPGMVSDGVGDLQHLACPIDWGLQLPYHASGALGGQIAAWRSAVRKVVASLTRRQQPALDAHSLSVAPRAGCSGTS